MVGFAPIMKYLASWSSFSVEDVDEDRRDWTWDMSSVSFARTAIEASGDICGQSGVR